MILIITTQSQEIEVIICVTISIFEIDSGDIDYHYTVSRNRIAIIWVTINIFQIDSGIANTSVKRTKEITARSDSLRLQLQGM